MCTVTYIPLPDGNIVTANRDEAPVRNADGLSSHFNRDGDEFLIAKEPIHGGANLAIGKNFTGVLLNGAFLPHERKPSYQKSRGLIVLDSLNLSSLNQFEKSDLHGVEAFTLIRIGSTIEELRWDESQIHFRIYETSKPLLVASAKLYEPAALKNRQIWFDELLRTSITPNRDEVWDFHMNGGDGDAENDMLMNRGNFVRTVSVSQVVTSENEKTGKHYDVLRDKTESFRLEP
jgi:hypothetical protein